MDTTLLTKSGVITQDDVDFANEVVRFTAGAAFLGGSYVVNGTKAHDIDVVIPHGIWPVVRSFFAGRICKVRMDVPVEAEDSMDFPDEERLVTVYRRYNVDLIVVRDDYVDSYHEATKTMAANPERFQERSARVAIHIHYADQVRLARGTPLEAEIKAARRRRVRDGESPDGGITFFGSWGGGGGLPEGYG
jgi:hypothetical protein